MRTDKCPSAPLVGNPTVAAYGDACQPASMTANPEVSCARGPQSGGLVRHLRNVAQAARRHISFRDLRSASQKRHADAHAQTTQLTTRIAVHSHPRAVWVMLVSAAALLVPFVSSAESASATGAADKKAVASAHLDFKIVIPPVIYMRLGTENGAGARADTVAIMSNIRTVTLSSTAGTRADEHSGTNSRVSTDGVSPGQVTPPIPRPATAVSGMSRTVIFTAAARKVIARNEQCSLGGSHATMARGGALGRVTDNAAPIICTASMP